MYLIVGLGNPGKKYEKNRHNVGFMAIDRFAKEFDVSVTKSKFKSLYGELNYNEKKLILMKPQTYMNASGEAVQSFSNYYNIDPENIIVIVDDIDINFGTVRIRKTGSAGTHNGLKSIVNLLGSKNFPRIKVSVGKKEEYMDLADFVISDFSKNQKDVLEKELDLTVKAILSIIEDGIDIAMNKINPIKF